MWCAIRLCCWDCRWTGKVVWALTTLPHHTHIFIPIIYHNLSFRPLLSSPSQSCLTIKPWPDSAHFFDISSACVVSRKFHCQCSESECTLYSLYTCFIWNRWFLLLLCGDGSQYIVYTTIASRPRKNNQTTCELIRVHKFDRHLRALILLGINWTLKR